MWLFFWLACSSPSGPDIIFLTIDTLRFDHIGVFSKSSPAQTPHIDSLAKDGVSYHQIYSPISVTGPAFATVFTGVGPAEHKVRMNIFRGGTKLTKKYETLAERFGSKGYATGAFVSGFTLHPRLGLRQGFYTYLFPVAATRKMGKKTALESIQWLKRKKGPLFLWYHSYDPHGPLHFWSEPTKGAGKLGSTAESSGENLVRIPKYQRIDDIEDPKLYQQLYAKAVEHSDLQIGHIIKTLKTTKRYDNALIVFTSDHGESFTERELWFDHGTEASEEQLHVPLIIKYPKNLHAGQQEQRLGSLEDIASTVLEAVREEQLQTNRGHSLLQPKQKTTVLFGESSHCKQSKALNCSPTGPLGKIYSIRTANHTLIRRSSDRGLHYEYYDRQQDPKEKSPLSITAPKELQDPLDQFASQSMWILKDLPWPPNPKSKEMKLLRSMGYIDEEQ